jgi:phospholipid/cholesterol/gamma-HCH transport system substrate-binding protein
MTKQAFNNIRLGSVVMGGLLFLVLMLYMIGKNRSLFGSTYKLKARFCNVQGLVAGNNVRFSGIETGTVKRISIVNDTIIEVEMLINKKMQSIIKRNAVASIGTEGLVGNKVVNIIPGRQPSSPAIEGDILLTRESVDTDDMAKTLFKTNNDVAEIAAELKLTVQRINNSKAFWHLLEDESIPRELRTSLGNIRHATAKAGTLVNSLQDIVTDIQAGKGSVGALLRDTSFALDLKEVLAKIKEVEIKADSLTAEITRMVAGIQQDVNGGRGPVNALLKDSGMVVKLNASLDNIQKGTSAFNENMEALKHNFLFRGYFRKLQKNQAKEK